MIRDFASTVMFCENGDKARNGKMGGCMNRIEGTGALIRDPSFGTRKIVCLECLPSYKGWVVELTWRTQPKVKQLKLPV